VREGPLIASVEAFDVPGRSKYASTSAARFLRVRPRQASSLSAFGTPALSEPMMAVMSWRRVAGRVRDCGHGLIHAAGRVYFDVVVAAEQLTDARLTTTECHYALRLVRSRLTVGQLPSPTWAIALAAMASSVDRSSVVQRRAPVATTQNEPMVCPDSDRNGTPR
jgi:hypothetical protein